MALSLEDRIDQQDSWTFSECLGLAGEFNVKVRAVVVTVYARGKQYVDGGSDTARRPEPEPRNS